LAFLEKIIPVNFFWTAFGQNALESFILKGFGAFVIGFESRTGHQQNAHLEWCAFLLAPVREIR
jgi:hypothetical protein